MKLKAILKQKNMSGAELARKIGVTPVYISNVANGKTVPSIYKCADIAKALNVSISELIGIDDTPTLECPYCHRRIKLIKDEG